MAEGLRMALPVTRLFKKQSKWIRCEMLVTLARDRQPNSGLPVAIAMSSSTIGFIAFLAKPYTQRQSPRLGIHLNTAQLFKVNVVRIFARLNGGF